MVENGVGKRLGVAFNRRKVTTQALEE